MNKINVYEIKKASSYYENNICKRNLQALQCDIYYFLKLYFTKISVLQDEQVYNQ